MSIPRFRNVTVLCASVLLLAAGCATQRQTVQEKPSTPIVKAAQTAKHARMQVPAGHWHSELLYPSGDEATSALLLEKVAPESILAGVEYSSQIRVTNLTDMDLVDVVVTETVPPQSKLGEVSVPMELVPGADGNMVRLDFGTLAPGQSKIATMKSTVSEEGTVSSCARAEFAMRMCGQSQVTRPSLALRKAGPASVLVCDVIDYTLTVTNTGTGTARGVKIVDPLPDGLQTAEGARQASFDVGDLAAGQSKEVAFKAKATQPGTYTNRASATAQGLKADSNEVATRVLRPVLEIAKTGPGMDYLGGRNSFAIDVSNKGDGPAADVVVDDTIPPIFEFVSASDGGSVQGGKVVWNVGTLQPGQSKRLEATFKGIAMGTGRNVATAKGVCAAEVQAEASTQIVGIPALLLEVIDELDPIKVGETELYTITVTNQGTAKATRIGIECMLENMTYVSSTGPTSSKVEGAAVRFDPLPELAPGAVAAWTVTTRADKSGDTRFGVNMTAAELSRPVSETEATRIYQPGELQQ